MSEKRYEAVMTYDCEEEGLLNEVMTPSGERWGPVECADLLNTQAETIEVLREWIRENEMMVRMETRLAESDTTVEKFKNLAKRRIAALEGK